MEDFIITTIYYDGQFWSAFIEKKEAGIYYTGRYVFGAEPTNPRLVFWMINEFDKIPLIKTDSTVKIKFNKIKERSEKSFKKSLDAFKDSQSKFNAEKKTIRRAEKREDKQEEWKAKQKKRKEKRKH